MTLMTMIHPDWQRLRSEIAAQALAACKKVEMALGSSAEPPPLDLSEALEDAANEYLNICDEISAMHRKASRGP
jgi:hypothetical protein